MFETVQKYLAKQLRMNPSEIRPESEIHKDLGADSLDVLQFLMTIEEEFGITVPDEELATFITVADVVAWLEARKQ